MAEIYKIRSFGGCMKSAFDLYATNLKKIIVRTWLPALLTSLCVAVCVMASQLSNVILSTLISTLFALLAYASFAWFSCIIVSLLNGKSFRSNLPHVAGLALLLLAVDIVLVLLTQLLGAIPFFVKGVKGINENIIMLSGSIIVASALVFMLLALPLWYSSWKYLIEPDRKLPRVIGRDYVTGLRHWGYLFIIALLTFIIVGVIDVVLYMPMAIAGQAMAFDNMGKTMGDASGLPSYFMVMVFFTALIIAFVSAYVLTWVGITFYYGYGNIEAKIAAKAEAKAKAQQALPVNNLLNDNKL